jgi:DNA gyrase subunit B
MASIERKAIPFREFLDAKSSEGNYPRYVVHLPGYARADSVRFLYTKEEFTSLTQGMQEKHLRETPDEEEPSMAPKALSLIELYEEDKFLALQAQLEVFGLSLENYLIPQGELFDIVEEGSMAEKFYTLKEVIEFFRAHGKKGVEIQRYKGLGEMNADQLWETTMNPEGRTLIQVTLPDAIAADHMFTMLMGEDVPPRRAFIESHALSVKNLDI